MAIQLDGLPKDKPAGNDNKFPLVPEGKQFLKILSAEVKSNENNKWLNVTFENSTGSRMYDRVFVTTNQHVQYKLQRFLTACAIPLTGSLELEDLAMLVKGKELYADVTHKENDYYDPPKTQSEIDIFTGDIFYRVEDEIAQDAPAANSGSY